jgi:hypothetical protein
LENNSFYKDSVGEEDAENYCGTFGRIGMNKQMKRNLVVVAVAVSLITFANLAFAHHGTGISYDQSKMIPIKGTVTEFHYANPHPQLFWDSKDDKGNVQHWSGEIASNPSSLVRVGWGRKRAEEALKPGTMINIVISPSKAGGLVALVRTITDENGKAILCANPGCTQ